MSSTFRGPLAPGYWDIHFSKCFSIVAIAAALILAVGCTPAVENRPTDRRLPVFAGVPPLQYVVEQIGGDRVKVDSLIRPGQDPHTFKPKPQDVVALGRAVVFFKIDMPFENVLLEKVCEGNQRLVVVDATRGIKKRPIDDACGAKTTESDHEEHSHADSFDPHVWLSPPLLKTMAENVAEGLCRADNVHAKEYRKNLATLCGRIDALHARVEKKLKPYRGRAFFVFHPGFGYFADAYGLKEESVEVAGRAPAAKQHRALIERARAEGVNTIFVQPEFDPESARVVAHAIDGQVVPINGLGRDVLADIDDIATKIEKSMREPRK